ncbi:hypothetical protein OSTOST_23031, partial [Ostertagia ostertagi]
LGLRFCQEYIRTIAERRPNLLRSRNTDCKHYSDCKRIRRRVIAQHDPRPLPFGVAYVRIVYEGYDFIEDELAASYHPQNIFCYSVDAKALDSFNSRIESSCELLPKYSGHTR